MNPRGFYSRSLRWTQSPFATRLYDEEHARFTDYNSLFRKSHVNIWCVHIKCLIRAFSRFRGNAKCEIKGKHSFDETTVWKCFRNTRGKGISKRNFRNVAHPRDKRPPGSVGVIITGHSRKMTPSTEWESRKIAGIKVRYNVSATAQRKQRAFDVPIYWRARV